MFVNRCWRGDIRGELSGAGVRAEAMTTRVRPMKMCELVCLVWEAHNYLGMPWYYIT
jgi:hypothetical protein